MERKTRYKIILDRDSRYDGQFYFAVKTTGIVCRPSCPATRPHEKNIEFYDELDSALRDGFRVCKRCKPEQVFKSIIAQSIELLKDNSATVTAKKLGITDRHLRRLTNQQVGTSPQKLLQSKRVLVTKNLLANTALPIIDVAFSAGFNSLRQFNDSFKQYTGNTPAAYRKTYAGMISQLSETTEVTVRLAYEEPFEWLPLKNALLAHMIPGLEIVDLKNETLRRLIRAGNERYVETTLYLDKPKGSIAFTMKLTDLRDIDTVVRVIKRVLDINSKPERVEKVLLEDSIIGPLFRNHPGLRVCGMFEPFELLINTIIGQQISISAARTFSERLVKTYGKKINDLYVYPSASQLLSINPIKMYEDTKLNHKKIATIQSVCKLIVGGFDLSKITHDSKAREELLAVKGIGPWTVEYVILRGFGDPDGFPSDDLFIKRLLGVKTAKEAERIAERWRPYRGYATMQLWTKGTYE